MNNTELLEFGQVRQFVNTSNSVVFKPATRGESYQWIASTLKRFNYFKLSSQIKVLYGFTQKRELGIRELS